MLNKERWITPTWPAAKRVKALSTLRFGGVSTTPFDNFNLGMHVNDDPKAVLENRRCLRELAQLPQEPCWIQQVHGVTVLNLDDHPFSSETSCSQPSGHGILENHNIATPVADASVSFKPQQVAVVLTADCLPILLCDQQGTRIAAVHAGWRGLAQGIVQATFERLACDPRDLMAWMGPAIGPAVFEVGQDVKAAFNFPGDDTAFLEHTTGKWLADLYTLARIRLKSLGILQVYGGGYCTYTDTERFYSYRRSNPTGRQATLIWLE